jgi:hypothetical protein
LEDVARCAEHRREELADCWADSVVVDDPVVVVLAVVAPVEDVVVESADRSEAVVVEAVQFAADPAEPVARALKAGRSGLAAARVDSCPDGVPRDE